MEVIVILDINGKGFKIFQCFTCFLVQRSQLVFGGEFQWRLVIFYKVVWTVDVYCSHTYAGDLQPLPVCAQIKSNVDPFFSLFDVPSRASRLDRKRIMRDRETIGYQEAIDLFVFSIFLPYFLIPFNFFPFLFTFLLVFFPLCFC